MHHRLALGLDPDPTGQSYRQGSASAWVDKNNEQGGEHRGALVDDRADRAAKTGRTAQRVRRLAELEAELAAGAQPGESTVAACRRN